MGFTATSENDVDWNKKNLEVIILDLKFLSFKVRMGMFDNQNHLIITFINTYIFILLLLLSSLT